RLTQRRLLQLSETFLGSFFGLSFNQKKKNKKENDDHGQELEVYKIKTRFRSWCLAVFVMSNFGLALLRLKDRVVNDPFCSLSNWKEEDEEFDHCSWFGVECSDGKVVVLNLKDLCLEGTLAPELGSLAHIKSIILRNNSFTGIIPQGIGGLEELEVLDLGYNNFSGPIPPELENNLSLTILLLDNNELLNGLSPEIYQLQKLSETQVDENQLSKAAKLSCKQINTWNVGQSEDAMRRRLLQARPRSIKLNNISLSPRPSPRAPTS
ncbi:hypothetical protein Goari_005075, partial [Gossypium aridum]|nr:hypothetical protein [Gossypium aridum]